MTGINTSFTVDLNCSTYEVRFKTTALPNTRPLAQAKAALGQIEVYLVEPTNIGPNGKLPAVGAVGHIPKYINLSKAAISERVVGGAYGYILQSGEKLEAWPVQLSTWLERQRAVIALYQLVKGGVCQWKAD